MNMTKLGLGNDTLNNTNGTDGEGEEKKPSTPEPVDVDKIKC
jgi:hypothetical protein